MSLEIFARQSLAQFTIIYGEIFAEGKGKAINPSEIETLMWGRMCAKEAGIVKTGFKIPYDNIKRAKVTLPYMPDDINYTGCPVIKKNGGLYTPCCGKVAEDEFYCKTCSVDKEGNVKDLEFGTTETRDANVEDGRFAPISFAEWMKAHKNMSLPDVYSKLREAGIALEIPASELVCRELPKRRKGRPAKSDDSVVDEDSVPKAKKAKSASEDEAPKKAKKAKAPEPESESEEEAPKAKKSPKASPKASPAPSEDEAPKKTKKAKAPEPESESEEEAPKAKKSPKASPKASPAPSEDEAPKAKKAKAKKASAASEDEAPKKAKKVKSAASEDEVPKAKKAKEPEPKAKKVKSPEASEDEAPKAKKAPKAVKAPEPEPEPEVMEEETEEEETEEQEIEIEGEDGKMHDYILRNGKFICDMDDGRILGTVNDEGEPEWA
jgi:hypothetical protein